MDYLKKYVYESISNINIYFFTFKTYNNLTLSIKTSVLTMLSQCDNI